MHLCSALLTPHPLSPPQHLQVIDLIEGKPSGILSILNEECVVPKGSDASFADKLFAQVCTQPSPSSLQLSLSLTLILLSHTPSLAPPPIATWQCITNKRLKRPLKKKDAFQISHFAGQVTYTTNGILEKNKVSAAALSSLPGLPLRSSCPLPYVSPIFPPDQDPVSEDLIVLLKGSDEPAVRQLFTESPDEAQLMLDRKKGAKFQVHARPPSPSYPSRTLT